MKKLLVVMLVLGMASAANADLWITVNGGSDDITLNVDETATVELYADAGETMGDYVLGTSVDSDGTGTLDGDSIVWDYTGNKCNIDDEMDISDWDTVLVNSPCCLITLGDMQTPPTPPVPIPQGIQCHNIIFTCTGVGEGDSDVVLRLLNPDGDTVLSYITITQTPEPMTIALLGLGGLFLRRRK